MIQCPHPPPGSGILTSRGTWTESIVLSHIRSMETIGRRNVSRWIVWRWGVRSHVRPAIGCEIWSIWRRGVRWRCIRTRVVGIRRHVVGIRRHVVGIRRGVGIRRCVGIGGGVGIGRSVGIGRGSGSRSRLRSGRRSGSRSGCRSGCWLGCWSGAHKGIYFSGCTTGDHAPKRCRATA